MIRFIERRSPNGIDSTARDSINWLIADVRVDNSGDSAMTVTVSAIPPIDSWTSSATVAPVVSVRPFDHGAPSSAALGFERAATLSTPDQGLTAPFFCATAFRRSN